MKIYAAPLQGYTEAPWRNAHEKIFGGIDAYFTPFIRIESGVIRNKDMRDINPSNNYVSCIVPQIIASCENDFRLLTEYAANQGYKWIDLNFGCPFPMITRRHMGCGILPFPDKVESIMKLIESYPEIDFSVKMRLGLENNDEWKQILPILNNTRLKSITLHPRIGKQQYKGDIDIESFANFKKECRHQLIYNGDLTDIEGIKHIENMFPDIEGIMIGRGLLSRPSLAWEYKNNMVMPEDELYSKVMTMHDSIFEYNKNRLQGDVQLLNKMKCYWEYLMPIIGKKKYKEIKKSSSISKYISNI